VFKIGNILKVKEKRSHCLRLFKQVEQEMLNLWNEVENEQNSDWHKFQRENGESQLLFKVIYYTIVIYYTLVVYYTLVIYYTLLLYEKEQFPQSCNALVSSVCSSVINCNTI